MQKCICLGLNHGTFTTSTLWKKSKPYYLGHFISVTGGQKAITLTAVKNKSFGGEQHWISILEYLFSTLELECEAFFSFRTFSAIMKYASNITTYWLGSRNLLFGWFTKLCRLSVECTHCCSPVCQILPQFILAWQSCLTISGGPQLGLRPCRRM